MVTRLERGLVVAVAGTILLVAALPIIVASAIRDTIIEYGVLLSPPLPLSQNAGAAVSDYQLARSARTRKVAEESGAVYCTGLEYDRLNRVEAKRTAALEIRITAPSEMSTPCARHSVTCAFGCGSSTEPPSAGIVS